MNVQQPVFIGTKLEYCISLNFQFVLILAVSPEMSLDSGKFDNE